MKIETHIDTYNTLEVDKVLCHFIGLPDPRGKAPGEDLTKEEKEPELIPDVRVDTKIYTDGEIIKTIENPPEQISTYYIGNRKYEMTVDILIKKKVFIKNASYIITFTIAK